MVNLESNLNDHLAEANHLTMYPTIHGNRCPPPSPTFPNTVVICTRHPR